MAVFDTRWQWLQPQVEARTVLDVGPAELVGTLHRHKRERWLHGLIAEVAGRTVGLEAAPDQVEALRRQGYDIRQGDAESFSLGERFEVVFAGELIEHLANPAGFLACAARHLTPGGRLLLTTPNRYSIVAFYRVLRSGRVPRYRKPLARHVIYFDSDALSSLLERCGFGDICIDYVRWVGAPNRGWAARLLTALARRLRPVVLPVLVASATRLDDEPPVP